LRAPYTCLAGFASIAAASAIRWSFYTAAVGRRRDGDGPAEVVGDPKAHGADHAAGAAGGVRLGWNAMRTLGITVALALVVAWAPAARAAGVHSCPKTVIHGKLASLATVLNVRDMRCRTAVRAVRRHGRAANPGGVGSKFRLGVFTCHVYFVLEEDNKARCVSGHRAFRVEYGA
jgi:hypothetical protein